MSLLTYEMETEILHWIAVSQKQSGGVDGRAVCRVDFALMASNPEHYERVKRVPLKQITSSPIQSLPSALPVDVQFLWSCWLCFDIKHGFGL